MQIITKMADRMLSMMVPEITAGACCGDAGHVSGYKYDCIKKGVQGRSTCVINCTCSGTSCGPYVPYKEDTGCL